MNENFKKHIHREVLHIWESKHCTSKYKVTVVDMEDITGEPVYYATIKRIQKAHELEDELSKHFTLSKGLSKDFKEVVGKVFEIAFNGNYIISD